MIDNDILERDRMVMARHLAYSVTRKQFKMLPLEFRVKTRKKNVKHPGMYSTELVSTSCKVRKERLTRTSKIIDLMAKNESEFMKLGREFLSFWGIYPSDDLEPVNMLMKLTGWI
jgi:hypothetical protein